MTWWIVVLIVIVVLGAWVTWTAMRIDRLAARSEAAWLRLDAALVRRVAALRDVIEDDPQLAGTGATAGVRSLTSASADRLEAADIHRAGRENAISAFISELPESALHRDGVRTELGEACGRVLLARTFYNDAVRATRALHSQRLPRWFRLGRAHRVPEYFDIDDGAGVVGATRP